MFILILFITLVAMEALSYFVHRFLFHGPLWFLHGSHHRRRDGFFEWNDLFPLIFASGAIYLLIEGMAFPERWISLALGIGISLYGCIYFFMHDLYIHRRVRSVKLRMPPFSWLKRAHALHHRFGGEPYGLLFCYVPRGLRGKKAESDDGIIPE